MIKYILILTVLYLVKTSAQQDPNHNYNHLLNYGPTGQELDSQLYQQRTDQTTNDYVKEKPCTRRKNSENVASFNYNLLLPRLLLPNEKANPDVQNLESSSLNNENTLNLNEGRLETKSGHSLSENGAFNEENHLAKLKEENVPLDPASNLLSDLAVKDLYKSSPKSESKQKDGLSNKNNNLQESEKELRSQKKNTAEPEKVSVHEQNKDLKFEAVQDATMFIQNKSPSESQYVSDLKSENNDASNLHNSPLKSDLHEDTVLLIQKELPRGQPLDNTLKYGVNKDTVLILQKKLNFDGSNENLSQVSNGNPLGKKAYEDDESSQYTNGLMHALVHEFEKENGLVSGVNDGFVDTRRMLIGSNDLNSKQNVLTEDAKNVGLRANFAPNDVNIYDPTKGAGIQNLLPSKLNLLQHSRVCYACSTLNNPSCWHPDRKTTVKYCRRGHEACVTKTFQNSKHNVILTRDCGRSCDDTDIPGPKYKSCSVCHTDLCNDTTNGASAVHKKSVIFSAFVIFTMKFYI